MTGITEGGIAIEVPGTRRRARGPGPTPNAEVLRVRAALARLLAATGYSVRDRARILCVPKSTLLEWERRTPEAAPEDGS